MPPRSTVVKERAKLSIAGPGRRRAGPLRWHPDLNPETWLKLVVVGRAYVPVRSQPVSVLPCTAGVMGFNATSSF